MLVGLRSAQAVKTAAPGFALDPKKYSGSEEERFRPILAAEHSAQEDGIALDHDAVRRWMLEEGLWSRQRKRSFHDWFEGRGPRGCLIDMVDDATSKTEAGMGKEETIRAAGILSVWIEKHGVPRALYTDWKNVYKRKPTPAEQLRGEVPVAQFGRMCEKLWDPDHCRQFTRSQGQSAAVHRVPKIVWLRKGD